MNHDDKTMLALAAVAYRGFAKHSEAAVESALRPWLARLAHEGLGSWDLVWGPAVFHSSISFVDDAMVYVARQRDVPSGAPPRFAVAIRGTSPVSAFDWFFGDFWVSLAIEWSSGDAAAGKISASTALGLAIIQHLAAEVPSSPGSRLAQFRNELSSAVGGGVHGLSGLSIEGALNQADRAAEDRVIARLNALTDSTDELVNSAPVRRFLDFFDDIKDPLRAGIERRVFDNLRTHIVTEQDPGEKLLTFLNRAVENGSTVAVTGHSKGGTLACAAALWLDEVWARGKQVNVECYSFAGPTAGNADFAAHYDARLAGRTRRIINRRDIVSQAWVPDSMRALREHYPVLGPALIAVANSVARLRYSHVGGGIFEIGSDRQKDSLLQEAIYQHLDAYLAAAQFQLPIWTTRLLFFEET